MKNYLLISVLALVIYSCKTGGGRQAPPTRDTLITVILHFNDSRTAGSYREVVKVVFDTTKYVYADTLANNKKKPTRDSIYYYTSTVDSLTSKARNLPMKDSSGKLIIYQFHIPNDYIIRDANWDIEKIMNEKLPQTDTTKK